MSSASPAPQGHASGEPKVQHSFDGDVKVLNGTFDSRMEIRKTLQNLQQILQRSEGRPAQIAADIKLRISGPDAKEHTYTVTINDSTWDAEAFAKQTPSGRRDGSGGNLKATASSPVANHANGKRGSSTHSDSREFVEYDDDDVVEIRPFKKARTEADDGAVYTSRNKDTDGLLRETLALLKQRSSNDALDFLKQWHAEWQKQGGWLFDTLNKAEKVAKDNHVATVTRVGTTQDVLGQSMNAANASTMAELGNISKLVPWVEHCRKTGADKVQAREEKWRTSSATFHDQSRRDREEAEKKLALELQRQRALLIKIAEANGVDVDEDDEEGKDGLDDEYGAREASLGRQLTAELNMEASRGERSNKTLEERRREAISVEDDDDDK